MNEKKLQPAKSSTKSRKQRHRQSEINLALFLFQSSYQGNHQDLSDVVFSDKIKQDKKWLVLNARDAEGMPILINCLKGASRKDDEEDHLKCVKILVSTGIPIDSKDGLGRTALHWSILFEKIEICKYLLEQGASLDIHDDAGSFPMHIAISKSSEQFVDLLCNFCSPEIFEAVDNMGRTPLCHALDVSSMLIFEKLLTVGADPNGITTNGKSLLTYIIEEDKDEFLEIILMYDVNLYPNGRNKFNMIHMAAKKKESNSLQHIASVSSDLGLQSVDHQGRTPLMYAVQYNAKKNVEFLLTSNVDSNLCDFDGKTVLHYTSHNPDTDCLNLILQFNKSLLNKCNNLQRTPLHAAIIVDNAIVAKGLMEAGANIKIVDPGGHSFIHYATEYSAVKCLQELICCGLSLNIPDEHNVYPIHYAVRLSPEEDCNIKLRYLKTLIQADVRLDVTDNQGLQPLHWAISMGFVDAAKELYQKNIDPCTPTKIEKLTPLHLACHSSQLECLEFLLTIPDIDINPVDRDGCTPLMAACSLGECKFTELLLNAGANANYVNGDGKTPAHIAAGNVSSVDCLRLLSFKGANLDVKGKNGETPLHIACVNPNEACMKFLLTMKCDVNTRQTNGMTALHLSIFNKNAIKASLLLQNSANCNSILYGEDNYTALDIALENGDYKCIKLLQRFGARTSHSILSNAAITIQHMWKKFHKNIVLHNKMSTDSSLCPLSNDESENQSDNKQHGGNLHTSLDRTGNALKEPNCNSNSFTDGMNTAVISTRFTMLSDTEFQKRIANGAREIQLMKDLMNETEKILVRAKHVNEVADSIINSNGFQLMRQFNKDFMKEKYLQLQANQNPHKHEDVEEKR